MKTARSVRLPSRMKQQLATHTIGTCGHSLRCCLPVDALLLETNVVRPECVPPDVHQRRCGLACVQEECVFRISVKGPPYKIDSIQLVKQVFQNVQQRTTVGKNDTENWLLTNH